MSDTINNRVFIDHGHFYTVIEESTWEGKYNPETKSLEHRFSNTPSKPLLTCIELA